MADPSRDAASGAGGDVGAAASAAAAAGPAAGPLSRAVVHEVLNSVEWRMPAEINRLARQLGGPGLASLKKAPRNSIIVRTVAGPGAAASASNTLCYPFFPPHMSMPVKPGEQVWVFNEAPGGPSPHQYWLCRVHEPDHADDINYTHPERRHDLYIDKIRSHQLSSAEGDGETGEETAPFTGKKEAEENPGPPAFIAKPPDASPDEEEGIVNDEAEANPPANPEEAPPSVYDQIYTGSLAMQSFTMEPVPRFTKRPGDFVLQGSNNTLICLGQDRGWNADKRPDGSEYSNAYSAIDSSGAATDPIPEYCGTIDIVSGRGRFYEASKADPDGDLKDTQPRVIVNTREKLEVDKNPAAYAEDSKRKNVLLNRMDRPMEGDPDFLSDCSRIYVSMRTNGDYNFNIEHASINPEFEGEGLADIEESPFIIMKSDEIRIVARKDDERDEVNGSIRIIKEGTVNEDQASIYLLPDGIVQLTGSKIYIGQAGQGHGPGESSSEPYVRYSDLQTLLTNIMEDIQKFCTKVLTHSTPGYGAPALQINNAATRLNADLTDRIGQIPSIKSSRIFGE
jgi:hypothetical protein